MDRKHRVLGEKRQRKASSSKGGPKDYELLDIGSAERDKARRDYELALQAIPVEQLYGHQLERRDVCSRNRKHPLKHPMDGHYHMGPPDEGFKGYSEAICCACSEEVYRKPCRGSWTKMKGLREKISSMVEKLPYYYRQCKDCKHKWRTQNPNKRPCSNCESLNVKDIKKEKAS